MVIICKFEQKTANRSTGSNFQFSEGITNKEDDDTFYQWTASKMCKQVANGQ